MWRAVSWSAIKREKLTHGAALKRKCLAHLIDGSWFLLGGWWIHQQLNTFSFAFVGDFVSSGRHIVSDGSATRWLCKFGANCGWRSIVFGCNISKWNERIVELTDKFGPLSGWPPLGVLFGEEGAGPVGGQRDAVHHQLVGVALGRILGHGRWQTFRFDEFRTSWRRSGRQQDHHHTEPDIGPHFCSNFSIFFRLQITICFGWNSSTPTGTNHWINDWNS